MGKKRALSSLKVISAALVMEINPWHGCLSMRGMRLP
jgi:hypothetical protein